MAVLADHMPRALLVRNWQVVALFSCFHVLRCAVMCRDSPSRRTKNTVLEALVILMMHCKEEWTECQGFSMSWGRQMGVSGSTSACCIHSLTQLLAQHLCEPVTMTWSYQAPNYVRTYGQG